MSSSNQPPHREDNPTISDDEAEMIDPNDVAEEIEEDADAAMDSGSEDEGGDDQIMQEIAFQNDSVAHFDLHQDSIFTIAQHPLLPHIVATGGSEGDDANGIGYVFDSTPSEKETPVLPQGWQSSPQQKEERKSLEPLFKIEGHTDSINALAYTLPKGEFLISGGLEGKVRAHMAAKDGRQYRFLAEAQEVEEVNWIQACPNEQFPNVFALGANDGSVWVYTAVRDKNAPLQIVQSYFLHTESCTAGAWSADGKFLATVSEDSSLYVWDVFGEAAAADLTQGDGGSYVVALTAQDQRFAVEGGLYSVAISPNGSFVVVGGAGGAIKVVGLPRLGSESNADKAGSGAGSKAKGGKQQGASAGQAGQILADLQAQSDGIETLAFAPPPLSLLAAGSVDGSIALFDSAHRFAVRRHIKEAHEEFSVVKVEFAKSGGGWLLTSCGMDGVVRRWDTRGATGAGSGLVGEWKGHRGEGEGGGVLGFVQGDGGRVVTAGDDSVALVFDVPVA